MSDRRFVSCPACDGSGVETFRVTVYEHGCGFPHYDSDERPCRTCEGDGVAEIEVESITLEDIEEVAPCPA